MSDINIVVVGGPRVGKSTFIRQALGLRHRPSGRSNSRLMSLEGDVQRVQLIEVDIECLEAHSDEQIPWRRMIEGLELPRIDGALMLYDVMNHRSIATVPEILGKLAHPPIGSSAGIV
jgi:GTPase SAR1 family protein